MSKNLSTERKRGYNQMSEPMEFENQVRVSAVGAKHSRRTALGEISKNKPKSSFASIKPALKSSKTSAGRVNVFQDKKSFIPDSLSSIESSPTEPPKRVLVPDLDCDLKDIFVVPEYAAEIDSHLREAELRTRPKPNYMRKQNDLTPQMRSILVDWLVEVAVEYKLNDETLYLAVNYVDRFLSQMAVLRGKLQLVGTAAMLLASKFEEIWAPEVTEFVYITDETYTRQQVLRMEHLMIKVLKFDICCVTPLSFINRLLKASQADEQTCKFARFLCDLTLLEYSIVKFCPSLVATAVVLQANYVVRGTGWSDTLEHYSGYSYEAVKPVIEEIQTLHQSSLSWNHQTVYQKHEGVSSIPPRSGNPPRHSQSTSSVDNDDMNMSVDSL